MQSLEEGAKKWERLQSLPALIRAAEWEDERFYSLDQSSLMYDECKQLGIGKVPQPALWQDFQAATFLGMREAWCCYRNCRLRMSTICAKGHVHLAGDAGVGEAPVAHKPVAMGTRGAEGLADERGGGEVVERAPPGYSQKACGCIACMHVQQTLLSTVPRLYQSW